MIVTVECVIDRHIYISIFTVVIGFIVLIGAHINRSKYNATASKMVSIGTCRYYNESHVNIRHLFHFIAGVDPGFQVRGGALKKIAPSGGRRENFWGISCEKSRFYHRRFLLPPFLYYPPPPFFKIFI